MDPYELGQLQETIRAAIIDGLKQDERAARLARIDETARAIFVAFCSPALRYRPEFSLQEDGAASYAYALALERARDEAVKEIQ